MRRSLDGRIGRLEEHMDLTTDCLVCHGGVMPVESTDELVQLAPRGHCWSCGRQVKSIDTEALGLL